MTAIADTTDTDSSRVEQLEQAVMDLQETVREQADRIEELEEEVADHKQHTGREVAGVRGRLSDVEEDVEAIESAENHQAQPDSSGTTPEADGERTGSQDADTPLARICALPEHVADRELTANQERARFIAKDVRDYADKAPAGLVVDSQTIKKVLAAAEGKKPHTQTVARVMDFLADLGKDDVEQTKRRGKKLVVIDPDAVDRYQDHSRCDRGTAGTSDGGVIRSV